MYSLSLKCFADVVDSKPVLFKIERLTIETQPVEIQINKHRETIYIDIIDILEYNIILGIL